MGYGRDIYRFRCIGYISYRYILWIKIFNLIWKLSTVIAVTALGYYVQSSKHKAHTIEVCQSKLYEHLTGKPDPLAHK